MSELEREEIVHNKEHENEGISKQGAKSIY